ncbi:MAG: carboxymuconolactone decarboxylase family protein [Actinobacteria bacterium]|nr:carboxymuconolactone decarboxylase family protein [Actinomycetota bacterium]
MSRLPDLHRDQLSPAGKALWDSIVATRGAHVVSETGALTGPFNAMAHAPGAGGPLASLGAALRFGTSLGRKLTEVAILTVASRWQAEFEWSAHARIAREAGVPDAVIDAIGRGEDPPFTADDERIIYRAARELITSGHLSQPSYDAAHELLGNTGVVELVSLCGYYSTISFILNAFEVPPPAGINRIWTATGIDR